MTEVKMKFNPGRHPQVMSRQKTAEECRSEFFDMFNTLHNVSTGFREDRSVSLQQFMEYHHFVGAHMDNDNYFKLFITGVWDLDIKDQSQEVSWNVACILFAAKNASTQISAIGKICQA